MKKIIVTGADGQLGTCLKDILEPISEVESTFLTIQDLDITDKDAVNTFFTNNIDYCINCAAYTNVDNSENEPDLANQINALSVKHLAEICKKNNIVLIHISTDFVFDGKNKSPYLETDEVNPLGVYGKTKLEGELYIQKIIKEHYILRTSWLYSEYGHNFLKTMLKLGKERQQLGVVNDQIGTPTYAKDLAKVIAKIITLSNKLDFGTYHYSNEGEASWYDFAKEIFESVNYTLELKPILTKEYPTPAQRPSYSVLNKNKIKKQLNIEVPYWKESLKKCISRLY